MIPPSILIGASPANKAGSLGFQTLVVRSACGKPRPDVGTVFMPLLRALYPSWVGVNTLREPTFKTPLAPTTIPSGEINTKFPSDFAVAPRSATALTIP